MKTAEEKAIEWLNDMMPGFDKKYNGIEMYSLIVLLKEQDRDTRHACAEAVMESSGMIGSASLITRSFAHDACMNVKAV